jgi:adenylate cyclase class IV
MAGFKIYVCKDIRKKINQLKFKSTYIDQKEKKIWKIKKVNILYSDVEKAISGFVELLFTNWNDPYTTVIT